MADADTALGEELPPHARPGLAWSLKIAGVCLVLWLGPVLALLLTTQGLGILGNGSRAMRSWPVLATRKRDRLRKTVARPV